MSTPSQPWQRLREERERLQLSQTEFGAAGGVRKQAQIKYEKGERKPDSKYFEGIAAAGADVAYILTGQRAALRAALADVRTATDAAMAINRVEDRDRVQTAVYFSLAKDRQRAQDEAALLETYRDCLPPDQEIIRQLAMRLASANDRRESGKKKR